jgi:hypothetical protein
MTLPSGLVSGRPMFLVGLALAFGIAIVGGTTIHEYRSMGTAWAAWRGHAIHVEQTTRSFGVAKLSSRAELGFVLTCLKLPATGPDELPR